MLALVLVSPVLHSPVTRAGENREGLDKTDLRGEERKGEERGRTCDRQLTNSRQSRDESTRCSLTSCLSERGCSRVIRAGLIKRYLKPGPRYPEGESVRDREREKERERGGDTVVKIIIAPPTASQPCSILFYSILFYPAPQHLTLSDPTPPTSTLLYLPALTRYHKSPLTLIPSTASRSICWSVVAVVCKGIYYVLFRHDYESDLF